eukprot:TRINITY_DN12463_c0_g1_i1.p3 TRINITY_DN12463_c0_g1~~TRINITY_DN12463_c0_g1_i1.p3  ORF type:complete len:153 (+),score=43.92 TRINITY_DN12463_c0_g1_i1:217-675(+)
MAAEGLDPPPLPGGMLRGMPPPLPGMARGPPPLPGMMPKAALPPPPKIKKPDFTRRAFHVERLEGPAVNSSIFTKVDAKLTIPKDLLREAFEQKPLTPAQMAAQKKKEVCMYVMCRLVTVEVRAVERLSCVRCKAMQVCMHLEVVVMFASAE